MPNPKKWFAQRFCRIVEHQPDISEEALQIVSESTLAKTVTRLILSEIATTHNILKQQLATPLVWAGYHLVFWHRQHLTQYIHHSPGKFPKTKTAQVMLQGGQFIGSR